MLLNNLLSVILFIGYICFFVYVNRIIPEKFCFAGMTVAGKIKIVNSRSSLNMTNDFSVCRVNILR